MAFGSIRKLFIVLDAQDKATQTLKRAESTSDDTARSMENLRAKMRALGATIELLAEATIILAGALALMVARYQRVDSTFARIEETMGATEQQMTAIQEASSRIGAELPVTMIDVANAFEQFAYAGFSAEESVASALETVNLAIAGQLQMAEAVRITTTTIRAFQLSASQVAAVTASLGQTFASSATNIQEMSEALSYIGPAAAQADQAVTSIIAAIGVLGDSGLRASRAGTSLERMFIELAKGGGETQQALDKLGLTLDALTDEDGQFKSLTEILQILRGEMEGMTEVEQLETLYKLFGDEGGRAAGILIDQIDTLNEKIGANARAELKSTIAQFKELTDVQLDQASGVLGFEITGETNATQLVNRLRELSGQVGREELERRVRLGLDVSKQTAELLVNDVLSEHWEKLDESIMSATTAGDIAAAQMETIGGKIEYVIGSIDSFAYSIYTGAKPAIGALLDGLIPLLDFLNENQWAAQGLGVALVGLIGVLATATLLAGAAYAELAILAATQQLATGTTRASTAAMWLWGASMTAVNKLIWLMTADMAALRASMLTTGSVTGLLSGAFGVLSGAATTAAGAVTAFFAALGPIGWLIIGIIAVTGVLIALWKTDFLGVGDEIGGMFGWIAGVAGDLGYVLKWLAVLFEQLIGLPVGAAIWAFGEALDWAVGVGQDFMDWFDRLPLVGKVVMGALLPPVGIIWALSEAMDAGQDVLDKFGGAADSVSKAWDDLGLAIGDVIRFLLGPFAVAFEGGAAFVDAFVGGINSSIGWLADTILGIFRWIDSLLPGSDAEQGPFSNLTDSGHGFVEAFASGIMSGEGLLTSVVSGVFGGAMDAVDFVTGGASSLGSKVMSAVGSADRLMSGIGVPLNPQLPASLSGLGGFTDAAGSFLGMPSGVPQPAPSGTQKKMMNNAFEQTIEVIFQGEVHDVQQVEEQIREAKKEGAKEGVGIIEDAFGMALDGVL